jgi:hypothetical protein
MYSYERETEKRKIKKNEIEYSHSYQSKRLGIGDYPYDPTVQMKNAARLPGRMFSDSLTL